MSFTNHTEALVLDWLLTADAVVRPSAWYIGLFTAAPSDSAAGTEVSGGSYARQAVAFDRSATSPTQVVNDAQIEFPTATVIWGTITHAGVFDALSGGNLIAQEAILNPVTDLADPRLIDVGDIFRFNAGDFKVTLD